MSRSTRGCLIGFACLFLIGLASIYFPSAIVSNPGAAISVVALLAVCGASIWILVYRLRQSLLRQIQEQAVALRALVEESFLVNPCFTCQEYDMRVLEVSPNARSVHYQCVHCGKKMRAVAGTPAAAEALSRWRRLGALVDEWTRYSRHPISLPLTFKTIAGPLPYEETSRAPIPVGVRTEVWRRDRGGCVVCGSKENVQFDHIIPVALGGATSAQNLQLLCRQCNLAKGARI